MDATPEDTHSLLDQILAIWYQPETDESCEYYRIRYQGGKLQIAREMTGMTDSITRLKTLNPAVDLSSLSASTWPDLAARRTERADAFPQPGPH